MNIIKRKLILSILAVMAIIVTLTSTTYAWFAKNAVAYIDPFEIEIENYDGLVISVDGKNFSASIGNSELKKAIVAKKEGKDIDDPTLTSGYIESEFTKFRFSDVTTNNLKDFKEIDARSHEGGYYGFRVANSYHYVTFDLYFKVESFGSGTNEYDLAFVNRDVVDTVDSEISFIESGTVQSKAITPFDVGETHYEADDIIEFDPADAMRLGLHNTETDETFVYEPNLGTSSYALDGGTNEHDPKNNLAFQYLNAYHNHQLSPLKVSDTDTFDYESTYKDFSDDVILGSFTRTNDGYSTIKLEAAIWLEGFDGDYISGASLKPIRCYFSFYKKLKG